MEPAQPPLPTASSFPFQSPAAGNHTSKLILESGEGFSTPTTRQKAGTGAPAGPAPAGPAAPRPWATSPPSGGGSSFGGGSAGRGATGAGVPDCRISVKVITVFGSGNDLRFSQGVTAKSISKSTTAKLTMSSFLLAGDPAHVHHTYGRLLHLQKSRSGALFGGFRIPLYALVAGGIGIRIAGLAI